MTPTDHQQINVSIAEAMGWQLIPVSGPINTAIAKMMGCKPAGSDSVWQTTTGNTCFLPNFCASLDAIAQAEATMDLKQRVDYLNELARVCGTEKDKVFATAAQRAEALCRTLKLGPWREAAVQT